MGFAEGVGSSVPIGAVGVGEAGKRDSGLGSSGGGSGMQLFSQYRVGIAGRGSAHLDDGHGQGGARRGKEGAPVVDMASHATLGDKFGAELANMVGEDGIAGLGVRPGEKVRVMDAAAEHEGLPVLGSDVSRHLFEAIFRLVGVLVRQGGLAAKPGVFGKDGGIEGRYAGHRRGCILPFLGVPRNDSPPDDVKEGGAVIVVPAVPRREDELADFQLHFVPDLERPVFRNLGGNGRGVVELRFPRKADGGVGGDQGGLDIVMVGGEGGGAVLGKKEGAEFGRIELGVGEEVEGDGISALGDPVDNFQFQHALLPIPGEIVVVAVGIPTDDALPGVAVACTIRPAGDFCLGGFRHRIGLQGGGGSEEGLENGLGFRLGREGGCSDGAVPVNGVGNHGQVIGLPLRQARKGDGLHVPEIDRLVQIAGGGAVEDPVSRHPGGGGGIPGNRQGVLKSGWHDPQVGGSRRLENRAGNPVKLARSFCGDVDGHFRPGAGERGGEAGPGRCPQGGGRLRLIGNTGERRPGQAQDRAVGGGNLPRLGRHRRAPAGLIFQGNVIQPNLPDGSGDSPGGKIKNQTGADGVGGGRDGARGNFRPGGASSGKIDPACRGDGAVGGQPLDFVILDIRGPGADLLGPKGKSVGTPGKDGGNGFYQLGSRGAARNEAPQGGSSAMRIRR